MIDLKLLNRWNTDLGKSISAVGTDAFFPSLYEALRRLVKLSWPQIWLYHRDLPPCVLHHDIPAKFQAIQIDRYLDGPYREDPFYQISMSGPRNTIYRLNRITGGMFEESGYFTNYYSKTGTADEVIFLSRLDDGNVVHLSVMRSKQQGEFTQDEYDLLYAVADPISAIIKVHCQHDDFAINNLLQPGLDAQIDLAFRTFGQDFVSKREREVLELMLRGYGADTTAERFEISLETVRRHRKAIYKKLDVNSQSDLFALFINVMPFISEARGGDPLSVYMS
jgi:DNA-binding CsgD family transcriptional regulator